MSLRHYIALIAIAFVVTFALTPLVRKFSLKHGFVAEPSERKIHKKPIPQTGGVAMFVGMAVAVIVQLYGEYYLGWKGLFFLNGAIRPEALGVFAGTTLIFLVGLVDDIKEISPLAKFIGQILAAGIVIACGVRIDFLGIPFGGGLVSTGWMAVPITLIYIAGFTNVINLIDGLDGLAGGISAIAAGSLLFLAAIQNRLDAAVLAAVLIGACIAFLCFNFNPASIFMGDSGALMLGFMLASISLLGVMRSTATIALFIPLIIIGVPIFDTASAIIRRVRGKRPIQEADKGHIHHRLLNRGFNQRQTVVIIWIWSALLAGGGYIVAKAPSLVKWGAFLVLITLSVIFMNWLGIWGVAYHHGEAESVSSKGGDGAGDAPLPDAADKARLPVSSKGEPK